jgi:ribonuclease HI
VRVELWTDGSGRATGGPGGWAYVLRAVDDHGEVAKQTEASGPLTWCTNQVAELTAVISGLASLRRRASVTVVTDSEYVMHGFTKGWVERWMGNGWRNREGDPVANREQWEFLAHLVAQHDVSWRHVKGHRAERRCVCGWSGPLRYRKCQECGEAAERVDLFPLNARCDELAGLERQRQIEQRLVA